MDFQLQANILYLDSQITHALDKPQAIVVEDNFEHLLALNEANYRHARKDQKIIMVAVRVLDEGLSVVEIPQSK